MADRSVDAVAVYGTLRRGQRNVEERFSATPGPAGACGWTIRTAATAMTATVTTLTAARQPTGDHP